MTHEGEYRGRQHGEMAQAAKNMLHAHRDGWCCCCRFIDIKMGSVWHIRNNDHLTENCIINLFHPTRDLCYSVYKESLLHLSLFLLI